MAERAEPPQVQVILEATGVYHEAVTDALHAAGIRVCVVNPKQIKDFSLGLAVRTKTDGVDAFTLARFGHLVNPPAWVPPPPAVREWRALLLAPAIARRGSAPRHRVDDHDSGAGPDLPG